MENSNEVLPTPQFDQQPPKPKQWYQHRGVIAIEVLAILTALVSWAYFTNQPKPNVAPVMVHRETQLSPTTTQQATASSTVPSQQPASSTVTTITSPIDTSNWKIYTNNQYGISFKYPSNLSVYNNQYAIFTIQSTPKQLALGELFNVKGQEGVDFVTEGFQFNLVRLQNKTDFKNSLQDSTYNITKLNLPNIEATRYDDTGGVTRGPVVAIEDPNSPTDYALFNYAAQCDDGIVDRQQCTTDQVEQLFNQILSTFKFTKIVSSVSIPKCGIPKSANSNNPVDQTIVDTIATNQNVAAKINSGYKIEQVCNSAGKVLLFFDFATGYWNNATSVSDTQLNKMAEQAQHCRNPGLRAGLQGHVKSFPNLPDFIF